MTAEGAPTSFGEFRVRVISGQGERNTLVLERADEWVRLTVDLLQLLGERGWTDEDGFQVVCENATVRYRLVEHDARALTWTAQRVGPDPTSAA